MCELKIKYRSVNENKLELGAKRKIITKRKKEGKGIPAEKNNMSWEL